MQDEKINHYFKIGMSFYKKDLAIKYKEIQKSRRKLLRQLSSFNMKLFFNESRFNK